MTHMLIERLALAMYVLCAAGFLVFIIRKNKRAAQYANILIGVGFAIQTLYLAARTFQIGQLPVLNMAGAFCFFGWAVVGVYLILFWKFRLHIPGVFTSPLVVLLVLMGTWFGSSDLPLSPAFRSPWLALHLAFAFGGYGFFGQAFLAGIMYLIQEEQIKTRKAGWFYHRLPSLNVLDNFNYFCLTLGFPLMTLGIITGAVNGQVSLGTYWRWDPKEVWSLVMWLFYAALLHQRLTVGWRGRRAAIMAIIGFTVLCFTFLGVSLLLPGYHSFDGLRQLQAQ